MTLGFNSLKCYCDHLGFGMFRTRDSCSITLGFNPSRSATAIMTRWPEGFSRVVPIGDSPTITLGFSGLEDRWPEAFSRVVLIGDSPTVTLGFSGLEGRWPEAFSGVVVLCVLHKYKKHNGF